MKKDTIEILKEKTNNKNSTLYFTKPAFSHTLKMIEKIYKKPHLQTISCKKRNARLPDRYCQLKWLLVK